MQVHSVHFRWDLLISVGYALWTSLKSIEGYCSTFHNNVHCLKHLTEVVHVIKWPDIQNWCWCFCCSEMPQVQLLKRGNVHYIIYALALVCCIMLHLGYWSQGFEVKFQQNSMARPLSKSHKPQILSSCLPNEQIQM